MNAGTRLQARWRWNGRPLRVRVTKLAGPSLCWRISWHRWDARRRVWNPWRSYSGVGNLYEVIRLYRDYAAGWRGFE